ncbi:T9SS type A sorting domain-containing protein [Niastella caeni]|uniref:T9SS type A sorting domain-containing protein n=1 Tax=Niastella caeni TaxID=2569763 RepID=A0A4S8HXQ3_9BACT|nr:glycoside hydrolase family 44 protein [Niastella caeni]THU40513.1 T9SS type A sorting domain-containing protein [Niastella caeni]
MKRKRWRKKIILLLQCHMALFAAFSQNVTVSINATQNKRLISPYIYGRNQTFEKPAQFYKDAGLRFSRMNGGNNATGYNWRKKITVHPDWYNNVYGTDWDAYAQNIAANYPDMQGMFAFQLLGRVASNTNNNFNDWAYNQSQYWSGVAQNLAGGGTPDANGGSKALVDGNINLFTQPWPADSSVAILNHWFGANGLRLNRNQFLYWSMDNEVDIWNGTHDYAMPTLISAAAFIDRYIELARKAKALYPGIRLCGPVNTSEWFWYKWSNESIYINGRYYPWLEYFIKRLGDEYKATGTKLVDVVDIHNYPWYNGDDAAALQGHRIYYDTTYSYPGSNGVKSITGGWDASLSKQYIFKRIEGWLNEHFGANHGITCGVSEWGTMSGSNPNLESVIYASHLGTFANNGVELFSPWNWSVGMWETLHLFSRNSKKYSVSSTSSLENTVSAYSSVNENADSLTVMLVNRDMVASRTVTINLSNFTVANGNYKTLQLSSLPSTETFVSHTQNALKENTVAVNSNSMTITVPALSTTAILLVKAAAPVTYVTFTNRATGMGMDGLWAYNDEANAGQWSYNGGLAQQWIIEPAADYVKIKNRATGLYLDGMGRTNDGAVVSQKTGSNSLTQQWQLINNGNYVMIKNRVTGLYVDGMGRTNNPSDLGQWRLSNHFNQQWTRGVVGNARQATVPATGTDQLLLYPNPFTTSLNLQGFRPGEVSRIQIFDVAGKQVETILAPAGSNRLSIGASLKPGIYVVQIDGKNTTGTFKVVKLK